jgi:uncharacterized protein
VKKPPAPPDSRSAAKARATKDQAPEYAAAGGPGQWRLEVWAQPGAKKSEAAGIYQGRLKLKLQAPAVDGKANEALLQLVAALLELKANQVRLISGLTGRRKTVLVQCENTPAWEKLTPGETL